MRYRVVFSQLKIERHSQLTQHLCCPDAKIGHDATIDHYKEERESASKGVAGMASGDEKALA